MRTSIVFYKFAFRFQEKILFYNLNCTLFPGTLFLIKGGNGTGKSTFLRCVLGPLQQSSGCLLGLPKGFSITKQALYLPVSNYNLYKTLSILDNLKFWHLILYRISVLEYNVIAKLFYLYSFFFSPVSWLSLGQLKRLLLSFFLTINKPFWFFDEPLLGLDPFSCNLFFQLILAHRRNGGMVFLISHTEVSLARSVSILL